MSIAQNLAGMPMDVLQKAVLGQMPDIAPYAALSQLQKMVKDRQMQQSMQGQAAIGQTQQMQGQPPIAQQVMQAAQGIDSIPIQQKFAGGGIVAFDDGGYVDPFGVPDYTTNAPGYGSTIGGIGDLMNVMSGTEPEWQRERRFARQGIQYNRPEEVAPEGSWEEEPQSSKFNILGGVAQQISKLERALQTPGLPKQDKQNISAQLTKLYEQLKSVPIQAAPPRAPVPVSPQAQPSGGGIAALARPPQAPAMAAPSGLDSATDDLTKIIQNQAKPNDELISLQKQYMEAGEKTAAEREARAAKRAAENTGAKGFFSNPEMLGAAAEAARRGGVAGAAGAASRIYGQQEGQRRSERDKIDSIADANQQYRQALLEKQIAFRSGDVNRQREADMKVAEAKLNLAKVKTELTEKQLERQKDFDIADMNSGRMLQAAKIRTDGAGGGLDDQFKKEQIILQRLNSNPTYQAGAKLIAKGAEMPGSIGQAQIAKGEALQARARQEVYNQAGVPLQSGTSAQPGAGAALKYNPATGKIE